MPCPHPLLANLEGGCPLCPGDLDEAALEASIVREDFAAFVRAAWPTIEPTRALLPSIAIDALCAALQAAGDGRIKRLAIACPPGVSKSIVGAVAFPAWLLFRSLGAARVMAGSYSHDFATRDSRRCRDLITSGWYRGLVGGAWTLRADADRRDDFWTTSGGRRLVVSPGGKSIGERCTTQVIDDALSAADVHSPAAKREAARWLSEVLPSRLEDPEHDARVLIGQRLAIDDPISVALERGWRYLRLPALADDDPCELLDDAGELVWRDPRANGEPLVSLLGGAALVALRAELGSSAFGAQYEQRPADDSAAIIRRAWWKRYSATELPAVFDRVAIGVDPTFGSLKGDYAVAQVWASHRGNRYLLHEWRARAGLEVTLAALRALAARWPGAAILVEKAALGAGIVETLSRDVPGVIAVPATGSKAQRLAAIAPQVESGACYLPAEAPWVDEWADELAGGAKHDDRADACAYALSYLATGAEGRETLRAHFRAYGEIPSAARALGEAGINDWIEWAIDRDLKHAAGQPTFHWRPPEQPKPEETAPKPGSRPDWKRVEPEPPPARSAAEVLADSIRGGFGIFGGGPGWTRR